MMMKKKKKQNKKKRQRHHKFKWVKGKNALCANLQMATSAYGLMNGDFSL